MKKEALLISLSFILILSLGIVSAGWLSDFWNKITGNQIEDGTEIEISCYDSDGGADANVKGKVDVTVTGIISRNFIGEDFCEVYDGSVGWTEVKSCSGYDRECSVREKYCDTNAPNGIGAIDIRCPNGCSDGACVKASLSPSIALLSPNGGEYFTLGQFVTISWSSKGISEVTATLKSVKAQERGGVHTVGLGVFRDNNSTIPTTKYAKAIIPSFVTPADDWKLIISDNDILCSRIGGCILDESDKPFTIAAVPPTSINIISPNGGETWETGKTYPVSWESINAPSNAWVGRISLFKNNGAVFLIDLVPFLSYSPTNGSVQWIVPTNSVTGNDFKVQVILYKGDVGSESVVASDFSDTPFSIVGSGGGGTPIGYIIQGINQIIPVYYTPSQSPNTPCDMSTPFPSQACDGTAIFYDEDAVSQCTIGDVVYTIFLKASCSATTTCTDSDGGLNYYVKGTLNEVGVDPKLATDFCDDSFPGYNLREYYCDNNGNGQSVPYNCPNGCSDGACITETENIGFRYAYWQCQNGEEQNQGSPSSCKPSEIWYSYATQFCEGKCNEKTEKCGISSFSVSIECASGEIIIEANETTISGNYTAASKSEDILTCENSCPFEGSCLPIGIRAEGKYCNIDGTLTTQLTEGQQCDNNFECESNVCVSGQCVETSLIQKILEWFRNLFSEEE